MNQKLIIGILVALVLVGVGIFGWKTENMSHPEQIAQTIEQPEKSEEIESVRDLIDGEYVFTSIDTSDWQTYRNEEAGFEVRIPKNFEKTDQGITPKNPAIGDPESIENNVWFLIGVNSRLERKNFGEVTQKDFFDPLWNSFVDSENVSVSEKRVVVHNNPMILIKSILGKEPSKNEFGGWIEGAYEEESFFRCGDKICSIRISSHQYSRERQVLFYTILSTLRLGR